MSHFKQFLAPVSFLKRTVGAFINSAKIRHSLHSMSDHMLKDAGINRSDIDRIAKSNFERFR